MEPAGGGLPEQRADSSAVVPGKWHRSIHLFLLAEEGVPGLEGSPVQEVTFAEVPVMEASPFPGHVVASLEISGVQIQVYEGADKDTLQALLQAAK